MILIAEVVQPTFHDVYSQAMRNSLFTGFLTLSSFLLTTKTLLVIQFRKDVYENDDYLKAHRLQRPNEKVYGSLESLAKLLNVNILLALATSAVQFSLGFVESSLTTGICLLLPIITIGFTAFSVVKIRKNLGQMFAWLNQKADDRIKVIVAASDSTKTKGVIVVESPPRT